MVLTEAVVGVRHEELAGRHDGGCRGQDRLHHHLFDAVHQVRGVVTQGAQVAEQGTQGPLVTHVLGLRVVTPTHRARSHFLGAALPVEKFRILRKTALEKRK